MGLAFSCSISASIMPRLPSCTLHNEGVSLNTIRIQLGHESLDVTLAYLKGKDPEFEEAQEHANSSSLALYA